MNEFKTELELAGETRPALVSYDEVWGDIYLERVEIALDVNETYTSLGIYSPRTERRWLDITSILSDIQALELVKEIKEAAQAARVEDYDDSRLMALGRAAPVRQGRITKSRSVVTHRAAL